MESSFPTGIGGQCRFPIAGTLGRAQREAVNLRAIIFDFDGLVVDTERVSYEAWRALFAEHGEHLSVAEYGGCVGSTYAGFDPRRALRERASLPHSEEEIEGIWQQRQDAEVARLRPNPGIVELVNEARAAGVAVAIGSSSPREWLDRLLPQLGLAECFDPIVTREGQLRAKPFPDIFEACLRQLGVAASEAIVLEDSPHGVAAAQSAGIAVVAVPNSVTGVLPFPEGVPLLPTLAGVGIHRLARLALGEG